MRNSKANAEEAAKIFAAVAADDDAPQAYRDLAIIREITATFDTRKPADIVARLKPLAVPENAYYGSAGELLALAYLEQGKRREAGDLLAAISKSDDVPDSLRSRARQMAGQLGVDAIEDVDEVLEESQIDAAPARTASPIDLDVATSRISNPMTRKHISHLGRVAAGAGLLLSVTACSGGLFGGGDPKTTPTLGDRIPVLSQIERGATVDPSLAGISVVLPPPACKYRMGASRRQCVQVKRPRHAG